MITFLQNLNLQLLTPCRDIIILIFESFLHKR